MSQNLQLNTCDGVHFLVRYGNITYNKNFLYCLEKIGGAKKVYEVLEEN